MSGLGAIPTASGKLPLLGHVVPLLRRPLPFLTSLPTYGDLVKVSLGPSRLVIICDPDLTHHLLQDDRTYDKGGPLYKWLREIMGNGLIPCQHDSHRRQRRLIQPAFRKACFPGYADAMAAEAYAATGSWRSGIAVDLIPEILAVTSKVFNAALFSSTLPGEVCTQLVEDNLTIVGGFVRRMLMPPPLSRLPTRSNRCYEKALSRLRHNLSVIVAKRRAESADQGDLLSALLTACGTDSDTDGLADSELVDELVTFFLAGTETTTAALAWSLHLLSQHPDIEQRLYAEVDAVLGEAPATYADIPKLELTGRIITETLRLYPPAWFSTRTVTTNASLGGHTVAAGTSIAFSPFVIHHRSDLYDHPETFDPDRWSSSGSAATRQAHIPFGGGARKCIGDTFAMIESSLVLATIAARWRLEPVPGRRLRPHLGAVLRPRELVMRPVLRKMNPE